MEPFKPHPGLSDEINNAISESELQGGYGIKRLPVGKRCYVQTKNRTYTIERRADGLFIKGHPKYCPDFVLATIPGSTWGGSMIKIDWVGRGLYLEFNTSGHPGTITTSQIREVIAEP